MPDTIQAAPGAPPLSPEDQDFLTQQKSAVIQAAPGSAPLSPEDAAFLSKQSQGTDPFDMSPEDQVALANQAGWDPAAVSAQRQIQGKPLTPEQNLRAAKSLELLRVQGITGKDVVEGAKNIFPAIGGMISGAAKYAKQFVDATSKEIAGRHYGDQKMLDEAAKEKAELASATESGATALAHTAQRMGQKLFVRTKPATDDEMLKQLFDEQAYHIAQHEITQGKGAFLTGLEKTAQEAGTASLPAETISKAAEEVERTPSLAPATETEAAAAAGQVVSPEHVAEMAAGEPLGLLAFQKGFQIGPAVAKAALPPGVTAAAARAGAQVSRAAEVGTGRVLKAGSDALDWTTKNAARIAPLTGGIIGAVKGLAYEGEIPMVTGGAATAGYLAGEKLANVLEKTPALTRPVRAIGEELITGAPAKSNATVLARDIIQGAPGTAAKVGEGALLDAAMMASGQTPEERRAAAGMGTAFGAIAGAAGLGRRMISGQLIAPRATISPGAVKSLGGFSALDAAHQATMRDPNTSAGQIVRVNALKKFVQDTTGGDVFFVTDKAALADAMSKTQDFGTTGELRQTPGGAEQSRGFFKADLVGEDGKTTRRVIILTDADVAPHEAIHALDDVMGEHANRAFDEYVKQQYTPEQWEQLGKNYAQAEDWRPEINRKSGWLPSEAFEKLFAQYVESQGHGDVKQLAADQWNRLLQMNGGDAEATARSILTPEEQTAIADRYLSREVKAEAGDALLKASPNTDFQGPKGVMVGLAKVLASVIEATGGEPLAGRTSESAMQVPLKRDLLTALGEHYRGGIPEVASKTGKPSNATAPTVIPKGARPAGGLPVTQQQKDEAAAEATRIAGEAPDVVLPGGLKSQRALLSDIADAIGRRVGVKLNYLSAPDEPAAATSSNRTTRRNIIELFRTMPQDARALWEKTIFPERILKTKSGYQVMGWAPEVFASNAHKLAQFLNETGNAKISPYELDPKTGSFTPNGWKELYNDTLKFSQNQITGRTGSGESLVVPKNLPGITEPEVSGMPQSLDQRRADFINMLYNFKLPETGRMQKGRTPLNIAGQEVSAATLPGRVEVPVRPRGEYRGPEAQAQGIEGREIKEVNPVRNEVEAAAKAAGKPVPSFIEVIQKLNLEHIKEAQPAPEVPEFRGNTLTLSAGFAPAKRVAERDFASGWMDDNGEVHPAYGNHATAARDITGIPNPQDAQFTLYSRGWKRLRREGGTLWAQGQGNEPLSAAQKKSLEMLGIENELTVKHDVAGGTPRNVYTPPDAPRFQFAPKDWGKDTAEWTLTKLVKATDHEAFFADQGLNDWARALLIKLKKSKEVPLDFTAVRQQYKKLAGEDAPEFDDYLPPPDWREGGNIPAPGEPGYGNRGQLPPESRFQFSPSEHPDAITAAAIRNKKTGEVVEGAWHPGIYEYLKDYGRRIRKTDWEEGFTDRKGVFLNRDKAANRAILTKQVPEKNINRAGGLHSGDESEKGAPLIDALSGQFAPNTHPKAVKEAAVRDTEGRIWTAPFHGAADLKGRMLGAKFSMKDKDAGYVTNDGEFLNRTQAYERAIEHGQIREGEAQTMEGNRRLESFGFQHEQEQLAKPPEERLVKPLDISGQFSPAAEMDNLIKASPDEVPKLKSERFGGSPTRWAWEVGANAKTPEDLDHFRHAYDTLKDMSKEVFKSDMNQGMFLGQKANLAREAYEAATGEKIDGSGPAAQTIYKEHPDYQPPMKRQSMFVPDRFYTDRGLPVPERKEEVAPLRGGVQREKEIKDQAMLEQPAPGQSSPPARAQTKAGKKLEDEGFKFQINPSDAGVDITLQDKKGGARHVAGYLRSIFSGEDAAHIQMVYVREDLRRQGIGETLYRELATQLQKVGITEVSGELASSIPEKIRERVFGSAVPAKTRSGISSPVDSEAQYSPKKKDELDVENTDYSKYNVKPKPAGPEDKWTLKTAPTTAMSKGWILPNGEPQLFGETMHHQWLNDNPAVRERYGLSENDSPEDTKVAAVKKGFARINYGTSGGNLTVEARAKDWRRLAPQVEKLVDKNLSKVDNMTVHLLNDTATKVVDSDSAKLFTMKPAEKMQNLPFITGSEPRSATQGAPRKLSDDEAYRKAEEYFSLGHPGEGWGLEEGEVSADRTWMWSGATVKDVPGTTTHNEAFGVNVAEKTFKGRYDALQKKVSVVFPPSELRKLDHEPTVDDIPTRVFNSLEKKYGKGVTMRAFAPPRFEDKYFSAELEKVRSGDAFGQTFNTDGSVWVPPHDKPSDIVTLASVNVLKKDLTPAAVQEALQPYAGLLDTPGVAAGVFSMPDGKTVSVDLNAVVPQEHRENSVAFAKANNQVSIWDAAKQEEVKAGGTGDTVLKTPEQISDALDKLVAGEPVEFGETSKAPLNTKELENMTAKEIADYYPESVIPKKRDQPIPSKLLDAPLVKGMEEPEAVKAFGGKLLDEARDLLGDPVFQAGKTWYSEFSKRLHETFGDKAQIFAELLAATSPNTGVSTNFAYAYDALRSEKEGRFDKIKPKFFEGLQKIEDGTWKEWYEENKGMLEEPPAKPGPGTFLGMWVDKHDLKPRQTNGNLYGIHSLGILQVLARKWLTDARGPKTLNFVKNLLGTGHEATIDIWADRTLRRIGYSPFVKRWRILSKNKSGVTDKEFAFAQKVFRYAADELGWDPDALQAAMWFAEKKRWAKEGWGRLDLGDFRAELDKTTDLEQKFKQNMAQGQLDLVQPRNK